MCTNDTTTIASANRLAARTVVAIEAGAAVEHIMLDGSTKPGVRVWLTGLADHKRIEAMIALAAAAIDATKCNGADNDYNRAKSCTNDALQAQSAFVPIEQRDQMLTDLQAAVKEIIERRRPEIERVSAALLAKGKLSADDLKPLLLSKNQNQRR